MTTDTHKWRRKENIGWQLKGIVDISNDNGVRVLMMGKEMSYGKLSQNKEIIRR